MDKKSISEKQIDEIAEYISQKKLEVPAIIFLETNKPLALLGSAAVTVAMPFLGALFSAKKLKIISEIISDRNDIEKLIKAIEYKSRNK